MARNCVPIAKGFGPVKSLVPATSALPGPCVGGVVVMDENSAVTHYAGTASQLYKLSAAGVWTPAGVGGYTVPLGEEWRFTQFGTNLLASNISNGVVMSTGGASFVAVPAAPKGRYLTTVRDFVLSGSITGHEGRVQWSALGNATGWTVGTDSSDFQDAQAGGPVRGLLGGETAYIMQAQRVIRMVFLPGSTEIFQFDEVESARGLLAPKSLVQFGRRAWYLASDGFYDFDTAAGAARPIGTGKWAEWFRNDIRRGSETQTLGVVDPVNRRVIWLYVPRESTSNQVSRALLYDWTLEEATIVDLSAEVGLQWLGQGYTLDTMNQFGNLDTLPVSLDSPFWRGGAAQLGLFTTDHKMSVMEGPNMSASLISADGYGGQRKLITATRPDVDAAEVTVSVAMRERFSDGVVWSQDEALEDTGEVAAFSSGNYARARVSIPAGAIWSQILGVTTTAKNQGRR